MKNKGKYVVLSTVVNNDVSYVIVYIENGKERFLDNYSFADHAEAEEFIKNNKKELDDCVTNLKEEEKRLAEEERQRRIQQEEEERRIRLEQEKKRRKKAYDTKRFIAGFMAGVVTLVGGHFAGNGISNVIKNNSGNSVSTSTEVDSDDVVEKEFINYLETKKMLTDEKKNEGLTVTQINELIKEFKEELNLKADEYYKQELYKEVVDIDKFLELSDEEQLSYILNTLRNNGFLFNGSKYAYNYDENAVIVDDTEYVELTTERFEELTANVIRSYSKENLAVSEENIIKYVMIANIDKLSQDNQELKNAIIGEQDTTEVFADADLILNEVMMHNYNVFYETGKTDGFIWPSEVIFDKTEKDKVIEIENKIKEIALSVNDYDKLNQLVEELFKDLSNPENKLSTLETGVGYLVEWLLMDTIRGLFGVDIEGNNILNEYNTNLIKQHVSYAGDEKEFIENSMANAYTKNVLALLNGCPTYTLKRD